MSENKLVSCLNRYNHKFTLLSDGTTISFKPITTGQMKNLLVYEDNEDIYLMEQILDDLITGCVISDDFVVDDLYLQDRFMLLIEIRKKTKGSVYNTQMKCPKCGTITPQHIDLDKLEIAPFYSGVDKRISINDDFLIHVDYMTRGMQKEAIEIIKSKGFEGKRAMVEMINIMHALALQKFETSMGVLENQTVSDRVELLDDLDPDSYEKITKWFEDNDYGIIFESEMMCVSCDHKEVVKIPLSDFFA